MINRNAQAQGISFAAWDDVKNINKEVKRLVLNQRLIDRFEPKMFE